MNWFNRKTWTTKDGETLEVKNMGTTHIINTMKMIERNAARYLEAEVINFTCMPEPNGEMASYAFDDEFLYFLNMTPEHYLRHHIKESLLWKTMNEELDRRVPIRG